MLIVSFSLLAVCFKNAKQYDQAKDAYLKEAECHTENKTYPLHDLSRVDITVTEPLVLSLTRFTDCSMLLSKYIACYDFINKSVANRISTCLSVSVCKYPSFSSGQLNRQV